MKPVFKKLIPLFLLSFSPVFVTAQHISIDAIEIGFSPLMGESVLSSYSGFISNTRNPALFRTQNSAERSRKNETIKTGFQINFIFRNQKKNTHQFVAGFEASAFETDLYEISGIIEDTISVNTFLTSKNEFFFLKGGYNYVRTPKRRFTLMAGGSANFGIPVSAKTEEVITLCSDMFNTTRYSFFGRQSPSVGLIFSLGFRLKVVNNFSFSLTTNPGFQYQKIDGNPLLTTFTGGNFNLHFKLRDR